VAIVLDRRIDPDRQLRLVVDREPLATALGKIAAALRAGYCQFGPVAYLGPADTARKLRTLAALRLEEVKPLVAERARVFLELRTSHWDDLAEPRQILDGLADEAGVKLVGADQIPHDLWRGADLPPMSWIDRLTLLTAQFGLTYRITDAGKNIEVTALPDEVTLARTYLAPSRQAAAVARRWAAALPKAQVAATNEGIRVEGTLEDHEHIEARLQGKPQKRTTLTAGREQYQLSVESAALRQVVVQMQKQLDLDVRWDREAIERAGISVEQLISVEIKDASLEELLSAVLKGTRLSFRRNARNITIFPAPVGKD
jgi:hypothetical protein